MSAAETLEVVQEPARRTRSSPISLRFLASELRIIGGRRRNLAGLAVLAGVAVVLALPLRVSPPPPRRGPGLLRPPTRHGPFGGFAAPAPPPPVFPPPPAGAGA